MCFMEFDNSLIVIFNNWVEEIFSYYWKRIFKILEYEFNITQYFILSVFYQRISIGDVHSISIKVHYQMRINFTYVLKLFLSSLSSKDLRVSTTVNLSSIPDIFNIARTVLVDASK